LREQNRFACYVVDGEWVYNNLTVLFGHGGHGYVHECIPLDEIWVAECHTGHCAYQEEAREAHEIGKETDARERDCIIVHEITEARYMREGIVFWEAHNIALEAEKRWLRAQA
jgi:hypothetical protein